MKIIKFEAENLKRIKTVEFSPGGGIVQITGKNGQGKSSVLDGIFYALGGGKGLPKEPIRKGASSAKVALDLGEIKVTRKFSETGTTLTVESDKGARFPSPQRMLDDLIGTISFDPLSFSRMDAKGQFDTLRQVSSVEIDIEDIANKNRADYASRTELNRQVKALRAQADAIVVPEDCPAENPHDIEALLSQMQSASHKNADIEKRKAARDNARQAINDQRAEANELALRAKGLREKADELEKKLEAAEPLPDPVNVDELHEQIETGRKVERMIERRDSQLKFLAEASQIDAKAKALTEAMEARDAAKTAAIAEAKMPIPDITLGDGLVLYKGHPFDQASSAEQLQVSIAIAMASNPKLRVLRIKDGSLLDEESMKIISEMAAKADYQVWIETVHANGPVAIEMVDGMAKEQINE